MKMIFKRERGFTLIELMVSIVIVAILATIGIVTYSSVQKSARISKRIQDLDALKTALESYKTSTGFYPSTTNTIYTTTATCGNTTTALLSALVPTYMPALPSDPLGGTNCYLYSTNTNGANNAVEYKLRTNITSSGEMGDTEYRTQPNYIDPKRDNGSVDCTVETGGSTAVSAWAIYASNGTSASNGCAY